MPESTMVAPSATPGTHQHPVAGLADRLRSAIAGTVAQPGENAYLQALASHNTAVVHRPEVVVVPNCIDDVAAAVEICADFGATVWVHRTGHGAFAPRTAGVMIATAGLSEIEVQPTAGRIRFQAGALVGDVVDAAAAHGLLFPAGYARSVGAVGYVLGGGWGPLSRRHGFAADHVSAVEVVNGKGDTLTVSAKSHPDLFWALCGGKHSLGIVTAIEMELPGAAKVFGAQMMFAPGAVDQAVRRFADLGSMLELESTWVGRLIRFPDADEVPMELRGRAGFQVLLCHIGGETSGGQIVQRLVADLPSTISGAAMYTLPGWLDAFGDPDLPMPTWQKGAGLSRFDTEVADSLVEAFHSADAAEMMAVEVRPGGGALSVALGSANAVGGRTAAAMINAIGLPVPELFAEVLPRAFDAILAELAEWTTPDVQANFLGPATPANPADVCWPPAVLARLDQIRVEQDRHRILAPEQVS